jgi:hypothetical protein
MLLSTRSDLQMASKLTFIVATMSLVALVALVACGGEDPEPTATPAPTATPEPTATPLPTATPMPTAAPQVPDQAAGTGALAPLSFADPLAMAAQLSPAEIGCVMGVAEMGRLMEMLAAPEQASIEERTKLLSCFEDETLLRLYLTGVLAATGPLTVETSGCIRAGMEEVDLQALMLAGATGDEQAQTAAGMPLLVLAVTCLNDDEWPIAAAGLGLPPGERGDPQCLLNAVGGPQGLAQTLSAGDEASIMTLLGAAVGCGMQMPGGP